MSSSRPFPYVGMPVSVMHLGVTEEHLVEEVLDEGRTLVVGGETFTLRRLNGWFVRREEPYYGTRLLLDSAV
ncbi:MAG: hypothetical protein JWQ18_1006 [Conexibacter sp.]|nr:hypothetical protein [Conexibacter sp.]